jgi:transposase
MLRLPAPAGLIAGTGTEDVLGDKGCDSDANRDTIRASGECIPPRKNRVDPIEYDRRPYREQNVVERHFARIKQYLWVAARCDKKAVNFFGFIWVASSAIVLAYLP